MLDLNVNKKLPMENGIRLKICIFLFYITYAKWSRTKRENMLIRNWQQLLVHACWTNRMEFWYRSDILMWNDDCSIAWGRYEQVFVQIQRQRSLLIYKQKSLNIYLHWHNYLQPDSEYFDVYQNFVDMNYHTFYQSHQIR